MGCLSAEMPLDFYESFWTAGADGNLETLLWDKFMLAGSRSFVLYQSVWTVLFKAHYMGS